MSVRKLVWSTATDDKMREMRRLRMSWDDIGVAIGVSRNAALGRGFAIGIPSALPPPPEAPQPPDPNRPPMPAGDATSWGAITVGTALDGAPFDINRETRA